MRPFWTLIPQEEERLTQGTKDALADAECLRLQVFTVSGGDVVNADWYGRSAIYWMECRGLYGDEWLDQVVGERATDAARAAFRAVPELRG